MAQIRKGFTVPAEVPRYFADKGMKPAFSWLDVWAEEHAYAFTVAKAVDAELLATFKKSIQDAIERGEGFKTWQENLKPELERLGWWGKRQVADPTGKWDKKTVDFSNPRRLETIFWSNMRAARAAGQWERMQRTKKALPYILYVRTASQDPRPEHLNWVGIILPIDDPFWNTHFPPNGWGCKCAVRQITGRERDRLLEAKQGPDGIFYVDTAPPIVTKPFVNRRTGEISQIPNGIDPGWHTNPGRARAQTLVTAMQARLDAAGPKVARKAIKELFETPIPKVLLGIDERLHLPVAVGEKVAATLEAHSPLIMASTDTIQAKDAKHQNVSIDTFAMAQEILDQGTEVDEGQPDRRSFFHEAAGNLWKMVIGKSAGGYLRVRTLFQTSRRTLERAKRKQDGE